MKGSFELETLTHLELEVLRREKYPQFCDKHSFLTYLKKNHWVTVTSKNKSRDRKRYQVCIRVL